MTAISVDGLVALLLRLRYKEILTLKRMYISIATFWSLSSITTLYCFLKKPYNILVWPYRTFKLRCNLSRLVHKDFPRSQSSSGLKIQDHA